MVGFWYIVYHTLFFLDYYLAEGQHGFAPPEPFTRAELDPAGTLPERPYTRQELQTYLDYCREKSRTTIAAMTDAKAAQMCNLSWGVR